MVHVVDRLFRGPRLRPLALELFKLVGPKGQAYEMRDNHYMRQIVRYVLDESSNCIDVGAYHGDFIQLFLEVAPQGHHYAFEPIPYLAQELRDRFPQATVRQTALSDEVGKSTFHHVTTAPGYSGLRQRDYDRPNEKVELIEVDTERLDDLLPPDHRVDLIKVDVEGAELQVFRGAIRTLTTYKPYVLFEHGEGAPEHYGTTPEMVHRLLVDQCGLRIFRLDGAGPLDLEEFEEIYRRNSTWNFLAHR